MGRTPKGKKLTLRPVRLDDDVWAECQRLGKAHGTINEGLRQRLLSGGAQEVSGDLAVVLSDDGASATLMLKEQVPTGARVIRRQPFKGPILKPKDRKR